MVTVQHGKTARAGMRGVPGAWRWSDGFLFSRWELLMRWWMLVVLGVWLAGCENRTYSTSPQFALFETSNGVVYLVNQSTGELEVVSRKRLVMLGTGEIFRDDQGQYFEYLGEGVLQPVDADAVGASGFDAWGMR